MYDQIDTDINNKIEFSEFMEYIILVLNGTQLEKNYFIFKFISGKKKLFFSKKDLIDCYKIVNKHEDGDFDNEEEEKEMANIVYYLMNKTNNENVVFEEFVNFLKEDPNSKDLFNFFSLDAEMNRKKIRMKNNYSQLLAELENLNSNIYDLEGLLFPEKIQNGKMKKKKFQSTFKSVLASYKASYNSKLKKQINNNNKFNIKNKKELEKIINKIKSSSEKSMEILKKEIKYIDDQEKFKINLRNTQSSKKLKKQKVFLDNTNWEIVTTMVTGISKSLSITNDEKYHIITQKDFKMKNKIEIDSIFNKNFENCKFVDYCPYVFRAIRNLSGIDNKEYIASIGVKTFQNAFFDDLFLMLTEKSSGKSGSFFFYTSDGKYMIKTIKKDEYLTLRKILKNYFNFLQTNPYSLLSRYLGLHRIKCYKKNQIVHDIYILVMNNFFTINNPDLIRNKYDLKGSKYGRITKKEKIVKGDAKKDLNFLNENRKLYLDGETRKALIEQLEKDSYFLRIHDIIDYSLLLGIVCENELDKNSEDFQEIKNKHYVIFSNDNYYIYYAGIIDTLTNFGIKKRGEYLVKNVYQGSNISCVPPEQYQKRFMKFMKEISIIK